MTDLMDKVWNAYWEGESGTDKALERVVEVVKQECGSQADAEIVAAAYRRFTESLGRDAVVDLEAAFSAGFHMAIPPAGSHLRALAREVANVASVHRFLNGMVMTFDRAGNQMPCFQGEEDDVLPLLVSLGWDGTIHLSELREGDIRKAQP